MTQKPRKARVPTEPKFHHKPLQQRTAKYCNYLAFMKREKRILAPEPDLAIQFGCNANKLSRNEMLSTERASMACCHSPSISDKDPGAACSIRDDAGASSDAQMVGACLMDAVGDSEEREVMESEYVTQSDGGKLRRWSSSDVLSLQARSAFELN